MTKRFFKLILICLCLSLFTVPASANTVEFRLENIGDLQLSAFQLFFLPPDGTFGYPLDIDFNTFEMDFQADWGPGQTLQANPSFWSLESLIVSTADQDLARGIGAIAEVFNPNLKLNEGLVVTMTSDNTMFGIDINNPNTAFFDFEGTTGNPVSLILEEQFIAGNQIVTATVPIPTAFLLLGSGLIGMLGIRHRIKK